jgi:hypothetical protein
MDQLTPITAQVIAMTGVWGLSTVKVDLCQVNMTSLTQTQERPMADGRRG